VLSLEHLGRPNGVYDGMCLSLLVEVKSLELKCSDYQWATPDHSLQQMLQEAMANSAEISFLH